MGPYLKRDSPTLDSLTLNIALRFANKHNQKQNEESLEKLNIEDRSKSLCQNFLVSEGSLADDAGLKVGDLVIEFGTQNATNFKSLAEIGRLVKNSENRNIRVRILQNLPFGELVTTLTLVPKQCSGQGLLGCKLVPL